MLQAYIDDSGNIGDSPVFVLAGFASTADRWQSFSSEWDAALNISPSLAYFKTKEAAQGSGEFKGWKVDAITGRVSELVRIIDNHAAFGIGCVVDCAGYKNVFPGKVARAMDNPYFMAFFGVMNCLMRLQDRIGNPKKVDYIFDQQMFEDQRVLNAWGLYKRYAPATAIGRIGGTPRFESDRDFLPLQAADLLAWKIRREEYDKSKDKKHPLLSIISFQNLHIEIDYIDEVRLKQLFGRSQELKAEHGIVHPYDNPKGKKK